LRIGMAIALASVSAVLFGFSNICFKLGVGPMGEFTLSRIASAEFLTRLLASKWILSGVLLTAISGVFYVSAMSYGDVIKIVAVLSLSYLVTAILARIFLGESLTTLRILGILFIIAGIVLVNGRA